MDSGSLKVSKPNTNSQFKQFKVDAGPKQIDCFYADDQASMAFSLDLFRKSGEIAIDFEFDRNLYTYGFTICLIQVAAAGHCFILDPLALEDLQPFFDLVEDPSILKIFHSGSQDVLLLKSLGCNPKNIYDTERAAAVLEHETISLSGFLSDHFDIELDKSLQRTNWNKRPLSPEHLKYSVLDVAYLHEIKAQLDKELDDKGRISWALDEFLALEAMEENGYKHPHLRIKNASQLEDEEQVILKYLFEFRDQVAMELNLPPHRVISNPGILHHAKQSKWNFEEWNKASHVSRKIKSGKYYRKLQEGLKKAHLELKEISSASSKTHAERRAIAERKRIRRARKEMLLELQKYIRDTHGMQISSLVLSSGQMKQFLDGDEPISVKAYAHNIILEAAKKLNLDLSWLRVTRLSAY